MLSVYNTRVCLYRGTDKNGVAYEYVTAVTPDGEFMFVVDGEEIVIVGTLGNAAEGELVAEFASFAEAKASGAIPAPPNGGSRVRSARKPRRRRSVA